MAFLGMGEQPRNRSGDYRALIAALQLYEPERKARQVKNLNQSIMKALMGKDEGEPLTEMDLTRIIKENPNLPPQEVMQQFKAAVDLRKRNYFYKVGQKLQEKMGEWKSQGKKPNINLVQEFMKDQNVPLGMQGEFMDVLNKAIPSGAFSGEQLKEQRVEETKLRQTGAKPIIEYGYPEKPGQPIEEELTVPSKKLPAGRMVEGPEGRQYWKPYTPQELKALKDTRSYDSRLAIAAQAVGVSPEKLKSGKLTKDEAIKIADKYKDQFGTESLLEMLLGGAMEEKSSSVIKFDAQGNRIQ